MKERKNAVRLLSMALVLLLCMGVIVACGPSDTPADDPTSDPAADSGSSDVSETPPEDTIPEDERDTISEYNFNGAEYKILMQKEVSYQFDGEETAADIISNAIVKRNTSVEERFKVKLTFEEVAGNWGSRESFMEKVRTDYQAPGYSNYELIATHSGYLANMALEGMAIDLTTLPELDVTKAWWSDHYYQNAQYDGAAYTMIGDLGLTLYEYMEVVFFNTKMAEQLKLGDLYQKAIDREWTYDMMKEASLLVTSDTSNADTQQFGLLTNDHAVRSMQISFDIKITSKNADGTLSLPNEATTSATNKIDPLVEYLTGTPGVGYVCDFGTHATQHNPIFTSDRALFYTQTLSEAAYFNLNMDAADFGILPFPLWNEDQTDYLTAYRDSMTGFMVPRNVENTELAGVVTEALCMYSRQEVVPAYYEVVLKHRYNTDPKASEILDIIRASVTSNVEQIYNATLQIYSALTDAINNGEAYSTYYGRKVGTWQTKLAEEVYENLAKYKETNT